MKTSDFDYTLPPEAIAQTPAEPRDASRLLVLERSTGQVEHRIFHELGDFLNPGDLLVVNQTRVIPARIYARKPTGGKVELLLLRRRADDTWECLVGGKGLSPGKQIRVENGPAGEIVGQLDGAERLVRFAEPIEPHFPQAGNVPLPPYIHQQLADPERYQTVYAQEPGSAAAPTAGLHFTPQLIERLERQGVGFARVTLHVGLDTFAPVTEEDPVDHKIHTEWRQVTPGVAAQINAVKQKGGRVIAVGTTSVRALESAALGKGEIAPFNGPTSIYILPGFNFRIVDAIITNFHLPRSTLIMMVSAFAGREQVLKAYQTAIKSGYRFYSFGDAMLIE
ncbi:MAG: tRNA preQ1(34) S-adenosylmethionine ribosyltransferase-isomerase QueA [Anaerolineales bacterium]|nr:tRNA preQ1(34) S-adenosylmethionine ribosyltransferase-isomerase QueA [Anaerolineales bacterium]